MSYRVLESIENISSCLKSLKNISHSADFHDAMYINRHIDRFGVVFNGKEYYLYVLKDNSTLCNRIRDNHTLCSSFGASSPFAKSLYFPQELLVYLSNDRYIYYDILLIERYKGGNIYDLLHIGIRFFDEDNYTKFKQLKQITAELLWLLSSKIEIEGVSHSSILTSSKRCRIIFDEKNNIIHHTADNRQFTLFKRKIVMIIATSWMLFFRDENNYKINEIMQYFLCNFDFSIAIEHKTEMIKESLKLKESNIADINSLIKYGFEETDEDSCFKTIKGLLELNEDTLEMLDDCKENIPIAGYFKDSGYEIHSALIENRIIIKKLSTGLFGYSDNFGNIICEAIFTNCTPFSEGIAVVSQNEGYYAINNQCKALCDPIFSSLKWYCEINRFIATIDNIHFLLDRNCDILNDSRYCHIAPFSCERAVVESASSHLKGYIDINGKEIMRVFASEALDFKNFMGRIKINEQWYSVTTDGELIKENR